MKSILNKDQQEKNIFDVSQHKKGDPASSEQRETVKVREDRLHQKPEVKDDRDKRNKKRGYQGL